MSDALDDAPVPDYRRMLLLEGKVFIVLGAGQGIGRQTAHALAQAGAKLVCVGRRTAPTEAVATQVGGTPFIGDANVRADGERLRDDTLALHGRIDGLVDILGQPLHRPLLETTDEDWRWQFDVSLRHAFLSAQLVGPVIGCSGGGSMVYVSSTSAHAIVHQRAAYAASKAALEQFVRACAVELGASGVRVNAVAPGLVRTPRVNSTMKPEALAWAAAHYPLGQLGTPPEIASVILFLACSLSSHVTGQTLLVEGGQLARSPVYDMHTVGRTGS
jgi:NAD(P)-dependent dehydrogenase (short-subunit alcohol dehydrogenase family)